MKHCFVFMAIILGMIAPSASAQTVKQKVAVYVTGDIETGYKKVIGSKLVTGITRSENFAAVERTADFLAELTKEQDYQMSGAVSDNQIARLGQQFGVRYVLVADISEVFESMFISARMIDVQTAQITNSAEASGAVSSIENLTKLAEDIVLVVLTTPKFTGDTVKLLQSCSSISELYNCAAPEGYHIATKEEILDIIKEYLITGKKLSFPIYTNIETSFQEERQYFIVSYYYDDEHGRHITKRSNEPHFYAKCIVTYISIYSSESIQSLNCSYTTDNDYNYLKNRYNDPGDSLHWGSYTSGLRNMATNPPQITTGYVYIVKNSDN